MNLSFGTPLSKGHFHSGDTKFGPDKYSHNLFIDYPCWNDTSIKEKGENFPEALNKRILRFILGDYSSPYNTLLSKVSSTSLCNKRIQNFLILLYKSLFFTHFPAYMKNMFSLRSSSYDLRGNYILSLSKPKTTTYGLNSFSYFSAKQWNALPDFFRTSFLQTLRPKYRMLPSCRFFLPDILKLKIVNCK